MSHTYTLNIQSGDPTIGLASMLPLPTTVSQPPLSGVAGFATAALPGFSPVESGTFAVYRRISSHPTVSLVMRMVTAPIVASNWGWAKRADAPAQWLTFARQILEPMRTQILSDALRALVFGFAAFEKIWQTDGHGRVVLARLKPLLPELTQILVDSNGNFAGVKNQSPGKPPLTLDASKSFLYTYDGECGNLYGRSRHENVRITWHQAMQTAEKLAQYQKKIAGVIAQLHYPEGTSRDAAGVERSNDVIAQQILEAVSMGRSVRFPNLFASIDDPTTAADLAGKSQWVLSQFDPGGTDYSNGMLNVLANYDKLLFRGWLRPERTGLESVHASRADAQQHSESSVQDSELIDRDIAAAISTQVVDELLTLNFGTAAKGAVWIEPAPLSDQKTTTASAVVTQLLRSSNLADNAVAQRIDIDALLADLDVPVKSNAEVGMQNAE